MMLSAPKTVWILLLTCLLPAGCERSNANAFKYSGPAESPEKAVLPTIETIQSGTYRPLSRPLYLYVNTAALQKPAVRAFLQYYFSDEGQELVADVGYIKLPAEEFQKQLKTLNDAIQQVVPNSPDPDLKTLTGEVMVDGSSTVAPISTAVAEEFFRMCPKVRVPVGTSGTGGGFKKFSAGEIDICDASREISDTERELCRKAEIDVLELRIGLDGIVIAVNPQNSWIDGLTVEDLQKIWNTGSTVQRWTDLNPNFPDAPIKLFGPDTDSGTFEYFTEEICSGKGASRSDYQQSSDDNFLVSGIMNDPFSLGYFGFAYYAENQNKLKALAIAP